MLSHKLFRIGFLDIALNHGENIVATFAIKRRQSTFPKEKSKFVKYLEERKDMSFLEKIKRSCGNIQPNRL